MSAPELVVGATVLTFTKGPAMIRSLPIDPSTGQRIVELRSTDDARTLLLVSLAYCRRLQHAAAQISGGRHAAAR